MGTDLSFRTFWRGIPVFLHVLVWKWFMPTKKFEIGRADCLSWQQCHRCNVCNLILWGCNQKQRSCEREVGTWSQGCFWAWALAVFPSLWRLTKTGYSLGPPRKHYLAPDWTNATHELSVPGFQSSCKFFCTYESLTQEKLVDVGLKIPSFPYEDQTH